VSGLALRCEAVSKSFDNTVAVDGFDLPLREGSLLALLGPSGCGKTTALRVMAGLERADAGDIWVGDRHVQGRGVFVAPEKRRIGMVFQDWALFPHLDVWHNVAFGLPRAERTRVHEVLEMVRLERHAERMPHELSGGQQQRVALARALAPSPQVILLDEPFSNLDASLRAKVRAEVAELLRAAGATAIFVTHDQEEALSIADEVAVMSDGKVLQLGTPHEVYGAPRTREVAGMIGSGNFFTGRVEGGRVATPLGVVPVPGLADGPVDVLVRPESLQLRRSADGGATVVHAEFYGHDQLVQARLDDGTTIDVRLLGARPDLVLGAEVRVELAGPVQFFDKQGAVSPLCGISVLSNGKLAAG